MEAHAGPTPMALRKDALQVATRMIAGGERDRDAPSRPTAAARSASCRCIPNCRNVIPGRVKFSVDLRNADDARLDTMDAELRDVAARSRAASGLAIAIEQVVVLPAVAASTPALRRRGARGAQALGYSDTLDMVSGAGHDAVYVARVAPAGDDLRALQGRHQPQRDRGREPEHLDAGCNVLLHAMLARAL